MKSWLRQQYADALEDGRATDARYAVAYVDLDGDGADEAIVRLSGEQVCGSGGCTLHVLQPRHGSWRRISRTTITNLPIRLLPTRSRGWRDLSVYVRGGGIVRGYHAALSFDGRSYPLNPSVPPARPLRGAGAGRVIISEATPLLPLR